MIKKEKHTRNGVTKTYIKVIEAYRPEPGAPPKQRVIKTFGWLEDAEDAEAFMAEVEAFDRRYKAGITDERKTELPGNAVMYTGDNVLYNYGCRFFLNVYDLLGLGSMTGGDMLRYQTLRKLIPRTDCLYLGVNPGSRDSIPCRRELREHLERRISELTGRKTEINDGAAATMAAEGIVITIQRFMGDEAISAKRISATLSSACCTFLPGGIVYCLDVGGKAELTESGIKISEDQISRDYRLLQKYFHTDFYGIYVKRERFNDFLSDIELIPPVKLRRKKPLFQQEA